MSLFANSPIKKLEYSAQIVQMDACNQRSRCIQKALLDKRARALRNNKDFKGLVQMNNALIDNPKLVPLGGAIAVPVVYTHNELLQMLIEPIPDLGGVEYVGLLLATRRLDGTLVGAKVWDNYHFKNKFATGKEIMLPPENAIGSKQNINGMLVYSDQYNNFTWEKRGSQWLRIEELADGVEDGNPFRVTVWDRPKVLGLVYKGPVRCAGKDRVAYLSLGATKEAAIANIYEQKSKPKTPSKPIELF